MEWNNGYRLIRLVFRRNLARAASGAESNDRNWSWTSLGTVKEMGSFAVKGMELAIVDLVSIWLAKWYPIRIKVREGDDN